MGNQAMKEAAKKYTGHRCTNCGNAFAFSDKGACATCGAPPSDELLAELKEERDGIIAVSGEAPAWSGQLDAVLSTQGYITPTSVSIHARSIRWEPPRPPYLDTEDS